MEEHRPEIAAPDPRQAVKKKAYSTPRLSDFGSVEMLSLSGTGTGKKSGNDPGNKISKP